MAIKAFEGEDYLLVDLYSTGWDWPEGYSMPIDFDFTEDESLQTTAIAAGHIVRAQIPGSDFAPFMLALRDGLFFRSVFPDGHDTPWTVPSTDVEEPLREMIDCIGAQEANAAP